MPEFKSNASENGQNGRGPAPRGPGGRFLPKKQTTKSNPQTGNPNTDGSGSPASTFGFSKLTPGDSPNFSRAHVQSSSVPTTRRRKPVERKLNFSELIKVMYRGRWILLSTFVIVFAYAVYSTYSKPYIYGSSARLFIDHPPGPTQVQAMLGPAPEDHSIGNEMQFFKSHVVSQHVARLLRDYALGDRIEIDSLFTDAFGSAKDVPPDPKQLAIIRVNDNPKMPRIRGTVDVATLEARASAAVSVAPEGTNDYLLVSSEAYTPLDAAFLTNLYVVVFVKDNQARVRANSAQLKQYLFDQKQRSFDSLRRVENKLRDYLGTTSGMSAEDIAKSITTQYEDLKQKRQGVEVDLNLRRKVYADLMTNLDTVEKNYYDNLTLEPRINMLQKELTESEFEIQSMEMSNSIMDPRTKKYLKDEIDTKKDRKALLEEKLRTASDQFLHSQVIVPNQSDQSVNGDVKYATESSSLGTISSLRQSILNAKLKIGQDSTVLAEYDAKLGELHAEAESMPEKIVQTSALKRSEGVAEKMYGQLEDRYLEAWMTEESVFGNVKAEDPAALIAAPIRPNRQSAIVTGALLGLAIGIGIVVLLSFLDSTIRTPDQVEAENVTLLATIPVINHASQPLSISPEIASAERPKFTPHRASHLDPHSSVAESYRSLRTTVLFSGLDREIQVLAITSSAPQEGKSTTSSNMGIVMAQTGKKTLLIDADLRRPVLHSVFGLPREPGLTNLLFERATFEEAIKQTDVENLYVLPCGIIPPNPAELLGSQRMGQLIAKLREEFDMILLDTPPVVAVTDALLLGHTADATILVARADVTRIDALLRAMDSIERSGANMLGVVLNNFNVANAYGSYYKYYQYYHYYSSTPRAPKKSVFEQFFPFRPKNLPVAESERETT
ncbi:MAG: polysaccharide biosynthesis tyrosine autokinase [Bacteroidota bacterium]|nr:polysaccharide biosynthesis tyrosine autokinase [Bacteroidota bacterium]MDP4234201.1 polysaccharide biosynthesis tyrosine autokinase [Bacteroidota bacterium]MDP4243733.1 polysaccharide biosynthesis tyrosine autokinase [Bacteroidota bacterium]MDP4287902.1 polysaccharide biosynthesis tyrosine autokinase [Bacteroidota bacterium]